MGRLGITACPDGKPGEGCPSYNKGLQIILSSSTHPQNGRGFFFFLFNKGVSFSEARPLLQP